MDALTPCVVTRFLEAARNIRIQPMDMGKCPKCQGSGTVTEKAFDIRHTCVRCLGTGTNSENFKALQKETKDLENQYTTKYKQFQDDKKRWGPGRSRPQFGLGQGRDLQTLRAKVTARQEQLKKETARWDMARTIARVVGAAA